MSNIEYNITDLNSLAAGVGSGIRNVIVTNVNDHVVRHSVMTEVYPWHFHPNADETFLVLEGTLLIDLEDRSVELNTGQLFTVPRQVKHRTRPKHTRSVNITIERADTETVFC
jgi:mannose-6-phosphate isomerase-like protein (cupin superfamily)